MRKFVFISLVVLIAVLSAALVALVLAHTKRTERAEHTEMPINRTGPSWLEQNMGPLSLQQDGRTLTRQALISQWEANPNLFAIYARRGNFQIDGTIDRVSTYEKSVSDVSGFYVPLTVFGKPGVSLSVTGMTERRASQFRKGQQIKVRCKNARVVAGDLVFDACKELPR